MIVELAVLGVTGAATYFGYKKVVANNLDCPANNPVIKGLEKQEIKDEIKTGDAKIKTLKQEIKELEKERKDILAGSDTDKNDKAQAKLEEKNEKIKELAELETNLNDLKVVDKGE
jgi:cytochrome c-type biogenesis protein CcmH/NrfG